MLKILFIEDSVDDYELACEVLKKGLVDFFSIRVETKEEFFNEFPHMDVIIANCGLPNFDCEQALATWRASGEHVPFLILSGTVSQETNMMYQNLGATDFILKSDIIKLGVSIKRAMDEFQTRGKVKVITIDGSVIHEINNMLTVILGNTVCLLAECGTPEDKDALDKIGFACRKISDILNNLGK